MRTFTALTLLVVLAACGANGEPTRPSMNAGLSVSPNGVTPSLSIGTHVGPVWLSLGL